MGSAGDRLRSGMSVREVCAALPGWTFRRADAPATPTRFHTWDFTSPAGDDTVRVTFDGTDLCLWGAPAALPAPPEQDASGWHASPG